MPRIREVLDVLERVAPSRYAFPGDKVGLQVGDLESEVSRAAVSLDRSLGAIAFAEKSGCQLLLSHHPLIFEPLESADSRSHVGKSVLALARPGIAFIAAHTNWDSAKGGVNDKLVDMLGLENVTPFGTAALVDRRKLVFFCPSASVDRVVEAVVEQGAGAIGHYSRCLFRSEGHGSFIPGDSANPTIGQPGKAETVVETRVEMVLDAALETRVIRALRRAHPYEEPAFDLLLCSPSPEQSAGRAGDLKAPTSLSNFVAQVDKALETKSMAWGDPNKKIRKVAVVGGAADSEWRHAQRAGADVLLTGEVKQHVAVEASESGMTLIAAGHFQTEHPGAVALQERMSREMPEIEWILYTPEPGLHGRPFAVS